MEESVETPGMSDITIGNYETTETSIIPKSVLEKTSTMQNCNNAKTSELKMKKHEPNKTKETKLGSNPLLTMKENFKKMYDKVHSDDGNSKTVENCRNENNMKKLYNFCNNLEFDEECKNDERNDQKDGDVDVRMIVTDKGTYMSFKSSTNPNLEEKILCGRPGFPVLTPCTELIENAINKLLNKGGNLIKNEWKVVTNKVEQTMRSMEDDEALRAAKAHLRSCKQQLITTAIAPAIPPQKPPDDYTGTVYQCSECKSGFISQKMLLYHLNRQVVKFEYNCPVCRQELVFYNRCVFLLHVRSHNVPLKLCDIEIRDIPVRQNVPVISSLNPDKQIEGGIIIHSSSKRTDKRKRKLPRKENVIAEITISDDDDKPMANIQQPSIKKHKPENEDTSGSGVTDLKDGKPLTSQEFPRNVEILPENNSCTEITVNETTNNVAGLNNPTEKGSRLKKLLTPDKKLPTETESAIEITNDESDKAAETKKRGGRRRIKFVPLDSTLLPKNRNGTGISGMNNKAVNNNEGTRLEQVNGGLSSGSPKRVEILNPRSSIEISNQGKEGIRLVRFETVNSVKEFGNGVNDTTVDISKDEKRLVRFEPVNDGTGIGNVLNDKAVEISNEGRRLVRLIPLDTGLLTSNSNNGIITLNDRKEKIVAIRNERGGGMRLMRVVAVDGEPGVEKCDAGNDVATEQTEEEGRSLVNLHGQKSGIQGQVPELEKETRGLRLTPGIEHLNTRIEITSLAPLETGSQKVTTGKKLEIGTRKSGPTPRTGRKKLETGSGGITLGKKLDIETRKSGTTPGMGSRKLETGSEIMTLGKKSGSTPGMGSRKLETGSEIMTPGKKSGSTPGAGSKTPETGSEIITLGKKSGSTPRTGRKKLETGSESMTPGKKSNTGNRKSGSTPETGRKKLETGEPSHEIKNTNSPENDIEELRLVSEIKNKKFEIRLPKTSPQLQMQRKIVNISKSDMVKMKLMKEDGEDSEITDEDDDEVSNITMNWISETSSTDTSPKLDDDDDNEDDSDSENTTEITHCHECHAKVNNLKKHFKKGVKIYECDQCNCVKRSSCSFRAHRRIHDRKPIHVCPDCGERFNNLFSFNRHLWKVCYYPYIKTKYKCKLCNSLKRSESYFLKHLETRHIRKIFKCDKCNIVSRKEEIIMKHILMKHGGGENKSKSMDGDMEKEVNKQNLEQGKEIASKSQDQNMKFVMKYDGQVNEASTSDPNLRKKRKLNQDEKDFDKISNNGKINENDEKGHKELYLCELCPGKLHNKDEIALHMCHHATNNENIIPVYTCKCDEFYTLKKEMLIKHMTICKKMIKINNNNSTNQKGNTSSLKMNLRIRRKKKIDLGITKCLICKLRKVNREADRIFCKTCILHIGLRSNRKYRCKLCNRPLKRDYEIIKNHFLKEHHEGNDENEMKIDENRKSSNASSSSKIENKLERKKERKIENQKEEKETGNKRGRKKKNKRGRKKGYKVENKNENKIEDKKEDTIKENINTVILKCIKCNYKVKSRTLFRSHIETHKGKDDHQCLECGECFMVQPSLEKHLMIVHGVSNITRYFNDNSLTRVEETKVATVEEKLEENQCSVCLLKCDSKLDFDRHIRLHGMAFVAMHSKST